MKKLKMIYRKRFGLVLSKEDLHGYHAILRLLYHKQAAIPLKDPLSTKYYISVPKLHLDLIIDDTKAEIVNSKQIYLLELNKIVLERAVKRIQEEVSRNRYALELSIRGKKQTIFENVYQKIK